MLLLFTANRIPKTAHLFTAYRIPHTAHLFTVYRVPILSLQKLLKNLTGTTDNHFFPDIDIFGAIAFRSTDKPAHIATLKFPCRALIFHLTRFSFPAWIRILTIFLLLIDKKP